MHIMHRARRSRTRYMHLGSIGTQSFQPVCKCETLEIMQYFLCCVCCVCSTRNPRAVLENVYYTNSTADTSASRAPCCRSETLHTPLELAYIHVPFDPYAARALNRCRRDSRARVLCAIPCINYDCLSLYLPYIYNGANECIFTNRELCKIDFPYKHSLLTTPRLPK